MWALGKSPLDAAGSLWGCTVTGARSPPCLLGWRKDKSPRPPASSGGHSEWVHLEGMPLGRAARLHRATAILRLFLSPSWAEVSLQAPPPHLARSGFDKINMLWFVCLKHRMDESIRTS